MITICPRGVALVLTAALVCESAPGVCGPFEQGGSARCAYFIFTTTVSPPLMGHFQTSLDSKGALSYLREEIRAFRDLNPLPGLGPAVRSTRARSAVHTYWNEGQAYRILDVFLAHLEDHDILGLSAALEAAAEKYHSNTADPIRKFELRRALRHLTDKTNILDWAEALEDSQSHALIRAPIFSLLFPDLQRPEILPALKAHDTLQSHWASVLDCAIGGDFEHLLECLLALRPYYLRRSRNRTNGAQFKMQWTILKAWERLIEEHLVQQRGLIPVDPQLTSALAIMSAAWFEVWLNLYERTRPKPSSLHFHQTDRIGYLIESLYQSCADYPTEDEERAINLLARLYPQEAHAVLWQRHLEHEHTDSTFSFVDLARSLRLGSWGVIRRSLEHLAEIQAGMKDAANYVVLNGLCRMCLTDLPIGDLQELQERLIALKESYPRAEGETPRILFNYETAIMRVSNMIHNRLRGQTRFELRPLSPNLSTDQRKVLSAIQLLGDSGIVSIMALWVGISSAYDRITLAHHGDMFREVVFWYQDWLVTPIEFEPSLPPMRLRSYMKAWLRQMEEQLNLLLDVIGPQKIPHLDFSPARLIPIVQGLRAYFSSHLKREMEYVAPNIWFLEQEWYIGSQYLAIDISATPAMPAIWVNKSLLHLLCLSAIRYYESLKPDPNQPGSSLIHIAMTESHEAITCHISSWRISDDSKNSPLLLFTIEAAKVMRGNVTTRTEKNGRHHMDIRFPIRRSA